MSIVLSEHLPLLATAPDGIQKLRGLILELAVRGKLVPQDPSDEPASELLKRIAKERARLEAEGICKKSKSLPTVGEDEQSFSVPDDWAWVRLATIGNIFNGNSINADEKDAKFRRNDGLPYIATKDVGYGLSLLDYENGVRIPESEPNFKIAHTGAVFICAEGGSAGKKCGLSDRNVFFGNKLFANEPLAEIPSRFVLYIYLAPFFREKFSSVMTGIIGGVSIAKFIEIAIPLPPLAEQHRIVAKVDELMALCDRLEAEQADAEAAHAKLVETLLGTLTQSSDAADLAANWQRLAEHFDTLFTTESSLNALKQTILQLAVMGKLVPQDPNDEPASATPSKGHTGHACDQTSEADVAPFAIPPRWRWEKLQLLLEPGRDISYGVIKLGTEPKTGGVWTLRCSDVKPGMINLFGVRKVSDEIERNYIRTRLTGGEILLNIRGTLGGVALVPSELAGYNVAREVAVIPVNKGISGKYLVDVMLSDYFWQSILKGLRGIAYKGLNLGTLRTFLIPLPPLTEQYRIVAKVDELITLCDRLKTDLIESRSRQGRLASTLIESALEAA